MEGRSTVKQTTFASLAYAGKEEELIPREKFLAGMEVVVPWARLKALIEPYQRRDRGSGIRISMDGRGRWMDNVFIERLWRSVKYECIYLHAFETGSEARAGIGRWIPTTTARGRTRLPGGRTPDEAHAGLTGSEAAA